MKVTTYKIPRHISRPKKTRFFFIDVPEAFQKGIGFQISTNSFDYGISIWRIKEKCECYNCGEFLNKSEMQSINDEYFCKECIPNDFYSK